MPKEILIQTMASTFKQALKEAYMNGVRANFPAESSEDRVEKFADQYVHDVFGKNVDQYELYYIRKT